MRTEDRPQVAEIVRTARNFNGAEIHCALEIVDIYLEGGEPEDYFVAVAEAANAGVRAYACWGATPLTSGTYDLYWIATHRDFTGRGFGRALMQFVEEWVVERGGRLLVVETSSRESYGDTIRFYRRLGYEETSRLHDFYDVGDDKLTFVKRLSR